MAFCLCSLSLLLKNVRLFVARIKLQHLGQQCLRFIGHSLREPLPTSLKPFSNDLSAIEFVLHAFLQLLSGFEAQIQLQGVFHFCPGFLDPSLLEQSAAFLDVLQSSRPDQDALEFGIDLLQQGSGLRVCGIHLQ